MSKHGTSVSLLLPLGRSAFPQCFHWSLEPMHTSKFLPKESKALTKLFILTCAGSVTCQPHTRLKCPSKGWTNIYGIPEIPIQTIWRTSHCCSVSPHAQPTISLQCALNFTKKAGKHVLWSKERDFFFPEIKILLWWLEAPLKGF